jgi:hypothetical protein
VAAVVLGRLPGVLSLGTGPEHSGVPRNFFRGGGGGGGVKKNPGYATA